jgi:hypothetical protein
MRDRKGGASCAPFLSRSFSASSYRSSNFEGSKCPAFALADIKPGSFVGIAAMPQPDGTQRALEVLIFPEAMRGTGEGHYPWDLQPKSTMTNANVEQVVTGVDGQTLTVKYKDGEKKIFVPPDVPIVTFARQWS